MKFEASPNSLRLVGKSWAIRAKLREIAKSGLTLQQFLARTGGGR